MDTFKIIFMQINYMKKLFIALIAFLLFSCQSKEKTTDDSKNKNEVGVQNANGGIPDTTNAINLSTHKKDSTSSAKDSINK